MMAFVFSASGPSWVMAETIASVTPPAVMLVQWEKPPLSRPADRAMLTSPAHSQHTGAISRQLSQGPSRQRKGGQGRAGGLTADDARGDLDDTVEVGNA